jgi:endonuclease III
LVEALRRNRSLLFLEDLVAEYGYGLTQEAIDEAKRRTHILDELAGGKRWQRGSTGASFQPTLPLQSLEGRSSRILERLLKVRDERGGDLFWPWLEEKQGKSIDKKHANKFLLGCMLDWQIPAHRAWKNARRLAEDILGDPEDLWETITSMPLAQWMQRFSEYSLHRFRKGHERVWTIGKKIVAEYQGDARNIWLDKPPNAVLAKLRELGVGEQISVMVVGALVDTHQIEGIGDVKSDRHVCRVFGRVLEGSPFGPGEAITAARQLLPSNPWLLDRPLYLIGKEFCFVKDPDCPACPMRRECRYYARKRGQA